MAPKLRAYPYHELAEKLGQSEQPLVLPLLHAEGPGNEPKGRKGEYSSLFTESGQGKKS